MIGSKSAIRKLEKMWYYTYYSLNVHVKYNFTLYEFQQELLVYSGSLALS